MTARNSNKNFAEIEKEMMKTNEWLNRFHISSTTISSIKNNFKINYSKINNFCLF